MSEIQAENALLSREGDPKTGAEVQVHERSPAVMPPAGPPRVQEGPSGHGGRSGAPPAAGLSGGADQQPAEALNPQPAVIDDWVRAEKQVAGVPGIAGRPEVERRAGGDDTGG